jgi:hypothetical protein
MASLLKVYHVLGLAYSPPARVLQEILDLAAGISINSNITFCLILLNPNPIFEVTLYLLPLIKDI